MSNKEILQKLDALAIEVFLLRCGEEKEPGVLGQLWVMAADDIREIVMAIGGEKAAKNHVNVVMAFMKKIAEQKGWDL